MAENYIYLKNDLSNIDDNSFKAKIEELGVSEVNLTDYYTKKETDEIINDVDNIAIVQADNYDGNYDTDAGMYVYTLSKTYEEIKQLLIDGKTLYLNVRDLDIDWRGIPYFMTVTIDGVRTHIFSRVLSGFVSDDHKMIVLSQFTIDENNKFSREVIGIPTQNDLDKTINNVDEIMVDRDSVMARYLGHYCRTSGVDGNSCLATWIGSAPTDHIIPKGSVIFIKMSDEKFHMYTTNSNIKMTDTKDFMLYAGYTDNMSTEIKNEGISLIDGADMYVMLANDNINSTIHTHSNKKLLDGITEGRVANWDAAVAGEGIDLSEYATKTDLSTLSTVATSGSYNDLSDKPTIPTVHNNMLIIQQNGRTVGTFKSNESFGNKTVDLTVPTKTSDLSNDSGFLTEHQDISGKADTDLSNVEDDVLKTKIEKLGVSGVEVIDNLASNDTDKALSANQGKVINISLSGKADKTHTHTKSQISDFPTSMAPTAHSHTQDEITGLKNELNQKVNLADIPTKTSDLSNDSGFLTEHQDISGKANADLSNVEDDVLKTKIESFNLSGGCKFATGSYVGTGKYGYYNQNTLEFDFTPKYVQIMKYVDSKNSLAHVQTFIYPANRGEFIKTDAYLDVSWTSNGLSWYVATEGSVSTDASDQQNAEGITYYYVAIG